MAQLEFPKPLIGAPFTAFETVTRTQGSDASVSTGTIARKADGSICWNMRTTHNGVEQATVIFIDNAAKHAALELYVSLHEYTSDPWQVSDTGWRPTTAEQYLKQAGGEGTKRTIGDAQIQTLGIRQLAGLQVVGFNQLRPIGTMERWYSPELDMNLERKARQVTPEAKSEMSISQLRLGEPDPKLFDVPPGFTEVDRKTLVGGSRTPAR